MSKWSRSYVRETFLMSGLLLLALIYECTVCAICSREAASVLVSPIAKIRSLVTTDKAIRGNARGLRSDGGTLSTLTRQVLLLEELL
jgi:hypothetical protein